MYSPLIPINPKEREYLPVVMPVDANGDYLDWDLIEKDIIDWTKICRLEWHVIDMNDKSHGRYEKLSEAIRMAETMNYNFYSTKEIVNNLNNMDDLINPPIVAVDPTLTTSPAIPTLNTDSWAWTPNGN